MSATFKLAKQKHSQTELRKLMNEQKPKGSAALPKKIDSPLAKYNELGQLTCILCKTVVRSDDVWKVHINAKLHKQNIEQAKQLKQRTNNFTSAPTGAAASKRTAEPITPNIISEPPVKRLKGILKNASTPSAVPLPPPVVPDPNDVSRKNEIPSDFFDKPTSSQGKDSSISYFEATMKKTSIRQDLLNINRESLKPAAPVDGPGMGVEKMDVDQVGDEALPEGFFDDPVKDAKARNLEYKDPVEEEWEKFQKEIKAAADFSNAIIAEDQEEATAERQIGEIDEQIRNWSRVLSLEKKRELVANMIAKQKTRNAANAANAMEQSGQEKDDSEDEDNEASGENEFDEHLDWRAKQSRPKVKKDVAP